MPRSMPYRGGTGNGGTRTRGSVARVLQNSQKFRVRVWGSYRTYRTSGYGYKSLTKHPELPGIVSRAYRTSPEGPGRYKHAVPVPRVFVAPAYRPSRSSGYGYEYPAEVTEVLCGVIPGVNPGYGFSMVSPKILPTENRNKKKIKRYIIK